MSLSQLTSPTAVRMAIAECDRLGPELFRRKYGFGPARTYFLKYEGKQYDSKAIAGVAHGYQYPIKGPLTAGEFTGGRLYFDAGGRLVKIGFEVATMERPEGDWTLHEYDVTVKAYFECLRLKLAGKEFDRGGIQNSVAQAIGQTRGAVDNEFQRIDGILREAELPSLNDSPKTDWQELLRYIVLDPLAPHYEVFEMSVRGLEAVPADSAIVSVPFLDTTTLDEARDTSSLMAVRVDFYRRDAANRDLGRAGEEWVFEFERSRLTDGGRPDLAEKVRWTSRDDGDGLGYDIESFELDGAPLYIEVKTTNQGIAAPFYLSATELQVSENRGEAFRLFRVFNLSSSPKAFIVPGPLSKHLRMKPVAYIALPVSA